MPNATSVPLPAEPYLKPKIFFDSWTTGTTGDVAAASIRRIDGTGRPRLFYAGAEALALRSASPGRLATADTEGTVHAVGRRRHRALVDARARAVPTPAFPNVRANVGPYAFASR